MNKLYDIAKQYKTISVVGNCKNAGKTTTLCALLEQAESTVAVTSVGYDGESVDQVYGTDKPAVYVKRGNLLATARSTLNQCTATLEILRSTGINTALGEVIICRALSYGKVLLAGPSIADQLRQLNEMLFEQGASRVLIDGALFRRSLAVSSVSEACILAVGASYSDDVEQIIDQALYLVELFCLPTAQKDQTVAYAKDKSYLTERLAEGVTRFYVEGALTDEVILPLTQLKLSAPVTLIASDSSDVLLSRKSYLTALSKGITLATLGGARLLAVTVNPYSVKGYYLDQNKLISGLHEQIAVPVFNVRGNDSKND